MAEQTHPPAPPAQLPSRAWSGSTLLDGANLVSQQQVKLEEDTLPDDLEKQLQDWKNYAVPLVLIAFLG